MDMSAYVRFLREVRIECVFSLDYNETLPMMNIPFFLEMFYTRGLFTTCYNCVTPPDSSVVRQLELHTCEMSEDELFWMFRSCKALRTHE